MSLPQNLFVAKEEKEPVVARTAAIAPDWSKSAQAMILVLLSSTLLAAVVLIGKMNSLHDVGYPLDRTAFDLMMLPAQLIIVPLLVAFIAFRFTKNNRTFNRALCGFGSLMLFATWGGTITGIVAADAAPPNRPAALSPNSVRAVIEVAKATQAALPKTVDPVHHLADELTGDNKTYVAAYHKVMLEMNPIVEAYQKKFNTLVENGSFSPAAGSTSAQIDQQTEAIIALAAEAQFIVDRYGDCPKQIAEALPSCGSTEGFATRVRNGQIVDEAITQQLTDLRASFELEVSILQKSVERNMLLASCAGKWTVDADGSLNFESLQIMQKYNDEQRKLDELVQKQAALQEIIAQRSR